MADVGKLVRKVLNKGFLMNLATADEEGPWAAALIYVSDEDLNLYWLSDVNSRHSKSIEKNGKAACTITINTKPGQKLVGLQIEGEASRMPGDVLEISTRHPFRRGSKVPKKEEKKLQAASSLYKSEGSGNGWYRLRPRNIELIYESEFGMAKKEFPITGA